MQQNQPVPRRAGARETIHDQHTGIDAWPLEFSGSGGEFFRVWIVNVLLSVVTFGLYTPFARRRTAQYFYSHTVVARSALEFTAAQRKMVFGFLALVVIYLAFQVASEAGQDGVVAAMLLGGAALAPYLWGSAMRFRMNATRWRGVRLQFTASWGEVYRAGWPAFGMALAWLAALGVIDAMLPGGARATARTLTAELVAGVLLVLALALAASLLCLVRLEYNYKSLMVARGRIGGQAGRWKPVYADFLRIWLQAGGVLLLTLAALFALAAAIAFHLYAGAASMTPSTVAIWIVALLLLVPGLFFVTSPARAYREARMFQLVWNNIGVSQIARFRCDLRAGRYVWLRIRNLLLTMLTLGFFRPFAMVSEYRMRAQSVTLHVKGGLDLLAGQLAQEERGLGDAIADAVGLDLVS
jgi:uncharacterized membrane protein YjgN (DUF898 family)